LSLGHPLPRMVLNFLCRTLFKHGGHTRKAAFCREHIAPLRSVVCYLMRIARIRDCIGGIRKVRALAGIRLVVRRVAQMRVAGTSSSHKI